MHILTVGRAKNILIVGIAALAGNHVALHEPEPFDVVQRGAT